MKNDSIPEPTFISFTPLSRGQQELNLPMMFSVSEPVASIDPTRIHLDMMIDSVWTKIDSPVLQLDSVNRLLTYSLHNDWEPGAQYRFTADSLAIRGIYGDGNKPLTQEFSAKPLEEYCNIIFALSNIPDTANIVVELLNSSDSPVATAIVDSDRKATFNYVAPGTYYARAFIDRNANALWDTGNIATRTQPEEVYYYPKKLNLRKNWDITQEWDIMELPVDKQKPVDITKNKPKLKANETGSGNENEEDEEDDDFYNPGFNNTGSNRSNTNSLNNFGVGSLNNLNRR